MTALLTIFKTLDPVAQAEALRVLGLEYENTGAIRQEICTAWRSKEPLKPCPHCASADVHRRGTYKGIPCFSCKKCSRYFRETTGTMLYHLQKKDKLQAYVAELNKGTSIRKTAELVGISIQTSFDWRHKILASTTQALHQKLGGIVQADELELPQSSKGCKTLERPARKRSSDFVRNEKGVPNTTVQVLTAVDEQGRKLLKAVETKRLTKRHISQVLSGKLERNSTLITDKNPSYRAYAKERKTIVHKTFLAKNHVDSHDKKINVQRVNQTHGALRAFLDRFNGVSTKYVQNYLNWFVQKQKLARLQNQLHQWFQEMIRSTIAYNTYKCYKLNVVNIRT